MPKKIATNPFIGRWRIVSMEQWDQEYIDEEGEGYFEFRDKTFGEFHFGFVHGEMACHFTTRDGEPAIEWTWEGNDEMDAAQGRGWAVMEEDELHGMIFFTVVTTPASWRRKRPYARENEIEGPSNVSMSHGEKQLELTRLTTFSA